MDKFVMYTHPASIGYKAEVAYELNEVVAKEGIERTKIFFSPIDFKWEDLARKDHTVNTAKRK